MAKDTKLQSLFRGRLGSAVLSIVAIVAVQYGLSETEVNNIYTLVATLVASGTSLFSAALSVISKIREHRQGDAQ